MHLVSRTGDALTECNEFAAARRELTVDLDQRTCEACRDALIHKGICPVCGDKGLVWGVHSRKKSDVADGRLTAHDVETAFYLGCEHCSETLISEVGPEQVAQALTAMAWRP